jgi:hypothetical protein
MGLAGQFGITGAFSHWQLWIGLGVMLHAGAISLNRHGRGGELEIPHLLNPLPGRRGPEREELRQHAHARGKGA